MGFLIKFFLFFVAFYLVLKGLLSFITGNRSRRSTAYHRQQQHRQRPQQQKQPETQKDRIIEYQKKSFESSEVEDVDFVEIKKK